VFASLLVGHNYKESFRSVLVGLQLVVGAVYSCASGEEEQELAGCMRVVGWFGDVYLDIVELRDLLVTMR
jgi:hypothetical protein